MNNLKDMREIFFYRYLTKHGENVFTEKKKEKKT